MKLMNKKTRFFDTDIKVIHICLGAACDLRCKYCYHNKDNLIYKQEAINDDIFVFIEEIANRQPDKEIVIRFFGGEPLLYYNQIKYVVEKLSHIKNISFNTITNGTRLTKDKIEFFNKYDFYLIVSWDGHEASLKYRGFDVMKEKRDLVLQANNVVVMATFVDFSKIDLFLEDLKKLNEEYFAIHNKVINWSWAPVDDVGGQEKFINNSNNKIKKYREKSEKICDMTKEAILKKHRTSWEQCLITAFMDDLGGVAVANFDIGINRINVQWGSDNPRTYALDLQGNLYRFHRYLNGTSKAEKLGDIYMSYYEYLYKLFYDKHLVEQRAQMNCVDCDAQLLCFGPGPHIQKSSVQKMCNIRYALYKPIVDLIVWLCNGGIDTIKDE